MPLMIGLLCVLGVSSLLSWAEGGKLGWGWHTRVRMSFWTASGPFGGLLYGASHKSWLWIFSWAALLGCAMLAYSLRPCKLTAWITAIGFILWQLLGFATARAGV